MIADLNEQLRGRFPQAYVGKRIDLVLVEMGGRCVHVCMYMQGRTSIGPRDERGGAGGKGVGPG